VRVSGQTGRPRQLNTHYVARCGPEEHALTLQPAPGHADIEIDGRGYCIEGCWQPGAPTFSGRVNGAAFVMQVMREGLGWRLTHRGLTRQVLVLCARAAALLHRMPEKAPPDRTKFVLSPMPGLLLHVHVAAGAQVKAGEELAVVEAMKMENILRAARDGTVGKLLAAPGQSLEVDQPILEFE
jgi:propionyl-CoA carboxylase alpha chain